MIQRIAALCLLVASISLGSPHGGLRLTKRALVAVTRDDHGVFITWRRLVQDGGFPAYDIYRASGQTETFTKIGTSTITTTFRDKPASGTYRYRVSATTGSLKGVSSNEFGITTSSVGRDWVTIFPGTKGKRVQLGNAQFMDTDGDGELEFVTHNPSMSGFWPQDKGYKYEVQVYRMFEGTGPKWSYGSGAGGPVDHHGGFHLCAFDLDGDYKAEIVYEGVSQVTGKACIIVLSDDGTKARELGRIEGTETYSMVADIGAKNFVYIQASNTWSATAWEWSGTGFVKKWSSGPSTPGACSGVMRTWTVWDLDSDGKDEIVAGTTVLDDNGSVLYSGKSAFGSRNEVGTMAIGDVDPNNPGLELFLGAEGTQTTSSHALFDAKTGKVLWTSGTVMHLHNGIIADVQPGGPLEIMGSCCSHHPKSWWGYSSAGKSISVNYGLYIPMISFDISAIDWLGDRGYEVRVASKTIHGPGGTIIYKPDFSDWPKHKIFPAPPHIAENPSANYLNEWSDSASIRYHWLNVDLVGDYREDLPFAMPDGSIRVYVNCSDPPRMGVTKLQYHSYQMTRAVSCRHGFAAAIGTPTSNDGSSTEIERATPIGPTASRGNRDAVTDARMYDLRGRDIAHPTRQTATPQPTGVKIMVRKGMTTLVTGSPPETAW